MVESAMPLVFRLDERSGVPTYVQLVQQVKQAARMGALRAGDRLPTLKEVVAQLAINPNTVAKAYRELERDGIVTAKPGVGTFLNPGMTGPFDPRRHARLRRELAAWVERARAAGLDDESLAALWNDSIRPGSVRDTA